MQWVIAYDVRSNRRRARLVRLLETVGDRLQLSVFAVAMTADERRQLERAVSRIVDPRMDRVDFLPLCQRCVGDWRSLGDQGPLAPPVV